MSIRKMLTALVFCCCFAISKGEAAWTNSGTYSSNGGSLLVPFENTKTGSMDLANLKLLSLVNAGEVSCMSCVFLKEVSNEGVLKAEKTKFQDLLSVSGGNTILTSCELNDLKICDHDKAPAVFLNGETYVHGAIIFETGNGKVVVGPQVVIKGGVIGGTLSLADGS